MPLKKHIAPLVIFLITSFFSFTQTEEEVKVKADALFKNKQYVEATSLYLRLLSLQPRSYEYNYKYGTCLLFNSNSKQDAIRYLTYALKNPTPIFEAHFFLGKAYHLNYQFNDAIKEYKNYIAKAGNKGEHTPESNRNIAMCENGKSLLTTLTDVIVRRKTEIKQDDFFRLYDLSDIGGSIITAVDFQTKNDKKNNHKPVVHISPNMENVYFSSYGDGNNLDIYVVRRLPGGKFGIPQKIAGGVNTPFDEDFPYMHPNGKELYFSSKGHNSMGGYDIFRARYDAENNSFGDVTNVDFSISSPDDDLLYVVDKESKNAYFSSKRQSQDGKIVVYKVAVERIPVQLAIVKGSFQSSVLPGSPKMTVEVFDKTNGKKIGIFNTAKESSYLITFPKGGKYQYKIRVGGSDEIFNIDVEIPHLKELRPLKQQMVHELAGSQEQIRITNLFDERFEDAQSIISEVLKERANLNVNEDQFDDEELEQQAKLRAVLSELYPETRSPTEVGQLIERKVSELDETRKGDSKIESASNAISLNLYNEILSIDNEIKTLVKEADASESNRRKELVLMNAKELYIQREEKLQKIQQIEKESNELAATTSNNDMETIDQLKEISNEFNQLLNEGKTSEIAALLEKNKDYLKTVLNTKTESGSEVLLNKQESIDNEIKRLQSIEQGYIDEINRLETEIKTLQEQKKTAKEKFKQDFQDKIDVKNGQLEDSKNSLSKVRALLSHEVEKRDENNKKLNIVHEIENYIGKSVSKDELAKIKASVSEEKSRTLKSYIETSLSELSGQPTADINNSTAQKTIEQYNDQSEEIYSNPEWNDYEKQQRLLTLNSEKRQEINSYIEEIENNASLSEEAKKQQKTAAQKLFRELEEDQKVLKNALAISTQKEISNLKTENIVSEIYPEYYKTTEQIQNDNNNFSETDQLQQLNNLDNELLGKINLETEQLKNSQKSGNENSLSIAKTELLENHSILLRKTITNREQEISHLQAQQESTSNKNIDIQSNKIIESTEEKYDMGIKAFKDQSQSNATPEQKISLLSNLNQELIDQKQQLEKIRDENPGNNSIDNKITIVENKINEVTILLDNEKTTLEKQNKQQLQENIVTTPLPDPENTIPQQRVKTQPELVSELHADYAGDIDSDFSKKHETTTAADQNIQRLTTYKNSLQKQLEAAEKTENDLNKQVYLSTLNQELSRVDSRISQLEKEKQVIREEIASQNQTVTTETTHPQTTKTPSIIIEEIQSVYQGNIQNDFGQPHDAIESIDQNIQRLTTYKNKVQQLLSEYEKTANDQEKENYRTIVGEETKRTEQRINELEAAKQVINQQKTITQDQLEITEETTQQAVKTPFIIIEEIQSVYQGNIQNDFGESHETIESINQNIQRIVTYKNQVQQLLSGYEKTANDLEKESYRIASDREIERIENRINELQAVKQALERTELITENKPEEDNLPQVSEDIQNPEKNIESLLINPGISNKERKELSKQLITIKREKAVGSVEEKKDKAKELEQQIASIQPEYAPVSGISNHVSTSYNNDFSRLSSELNSEKDPLKQELILNEIIVIQEQYINHLKRKGLLEEDLSVIEAEDKVRLYPKEQLTTRKRQAIIEIEELTSIKTEKQQKITDAQKKEQEKIKQEIAALNEKETLINRELTFIESQLELYHIPQQPVSLEQNPVTLTYNEERQIASSEKYEQYAKAASIQNELINNYNKLNQELKLNQQQLEEIREKEIKSSVEDKSYITSQKQGVIENIRNISISLSELEDKISDAEKNATVHLPTDPSEIMKFQNLVSRGVNPIKKSLVATALIPVSVNGIEFNPVSPSVPELKTIPVNLKTPTGLIYRVQVGAFARPIPEDHFKEFSPVSGELIENSNITRYMAGYFNNASSVVEAREKIKKIGYSDAFIVAYCDGKRISFGEARRMETRNECIGKEANELRLEIATNIAEKLGIEDTVKTLKPVSEFSYNQAPGAAEATAIEQFSELLFFTVQVGVYNRPVEKERLLNLEPLYTLRLENGQIRYSIGMFDNIGQARQLENEIRQKGISDAFVTAYYQGKRITIDKARALIDAGAKLYSETTIITNDNHEAIKPPADIVTEVEIFTDSKIIKTEPLHEEKYLQFISKESFESYPREELNRYNNKGVFHYDQTSKRIKSIFYPNTGILPRIATFSEQLDTIYFPKSDILKSNDSKITFILNSGSVPGDLNDWLTKFPYRKAYTHSENGIEIHIFDIRLEDVEQMKIIAELFSIPLIETQNKQEYDRNHE